MPTREEVQAKLREIQSRRQSSNSPSRDEVLAKLREIQSSRREPKITSAFQKKRIVKTEDLPSGKPRSTLSFLPRAVADIFTSNTQKFGRTLGLAAAEATGSLKSIDDSVIREAESNFNLAKQLRGASKERKAQILKQLGKGSQVKTADEEFNLPSTKQIIGQGIGTGLEALTGTLAQKGAALKSLPTVRAGIKTGAVLGGLTSGASGASSSLQRDDSGLKVALSTAGGAAVGSIVGGVLGGLSAKAGLDREALKAKQQLLDAGIPDSRIATVKKETRPVLKQINEGIRKDAVAKEVVKQGVPESHVAMLKTGSKTDKRKMLKMLFIRKSQKTNELTKARANDVVGDTFVEKIAKPLHKKNKEAGIAIDKISKELSGKKADFRDAVQKFSESLDDAGVKFTEDGLDFTGSDYEGITPIQKTFKNVWDRAVKVAKSGDAREAHRLKRFIDENVSYGSKTEGLSASGQKILKGLRRQVDGILDDNFSDYAKSNQVYSDTIEQLNRIGKLLGKDFRIDDAEAATAMGTSLRSYLSNNKGRAGLIRLLSDSQDLLKQYGIPVGEDIERQIRFANMLESIFGSEAPTSFLGQQEKAARATSGIASDLVDVISPTSSTAKGLSGLIGKGTDKLRGINTDAAIRSIENLLKR